MDIEEFGERLRFREGLPNFREPILIQRACERFRSKSRGKTSQRFRAGARPGHTFIMENVLCSIWPHSTQRLSAALDSSRDPPFNFLYTARQCSPSASTLTSQHPSHASYIFRYDQLDSRVADSRGGHSH